MYRVSSPTKIDVHAHLLPEFYRAAMRAGGHARPDGFPVLPTWDAAEAVETMDRMDIAVAILSISSPGVYFGDPAAASMNEGRTLVTELGMILDEAVAELEPASRVAGSAP